MNEDCMASAWRNGWILAILGIIVSAVSIWWWPGFAPPPISGTNPHTLYFLAAAAQSLAAVLALVFTITLVVAQLSSRYSHRMLSDFFDPLTIGYFLVFVIATLFPLWLLGQEQLPLWTIRASLTMTAGVLLLLLPYFLGFRAKLDPTSVINRLKDRASKRIQGDRQKKPGEVATIDNFCMSAFVLKDYDTFGVGVQALGTIALEASRDMKDAIGKEVFRRLMNIGLATIEDPLAPVRTIEALRDTGRKAVEQANEAAGGWSTFPIANIGALAMAKSLEAQADRAVPSLFEVGMLAVENEMGFAVRTVAGLCLVARTAIHQDTQTFEERIAKAAVSAAGDLISKAIQKGMKDEDTQDMVRELGLVHQQAAKQQEYEVLHAAHRWLYIIGAWTTKKQASRTREAAKVALKDFGGVDFGRGAFQRDYEEATEWLPTTELSQALAEFRKACYGD